MTPLRKIMQLYLEVVVFLVGDILSENIDQQMKIDEDHVGGHLSHKAW